MKLSNTRANGGGAGAGAMRIQRSARVEANTPSNTLSVALYTPTGAESVPVIAPVDALSDSPAGKPDAANVSVAFCGLVAVTVTGAMVVPVTFVWLSGPVIVGNSPGTRTSKLSN